MRWRNSTLPVVFLSLLLVSLVSFTFFQHLTYSNEKEIVFLSTTTSVENTGLLDYLIEEYEKSSTYQIRYTAVGSGAAIQLAKDGTVDAILTHAPDLEQDLVDTGYTVSRNTLWYNYFVLVGPVTDPANISSTNSPITAFTKLQKAGSEGIAHFYSRGDNSGTHIKELQIWKKANITIPSNVDWYYETGTGMASTLVTTDYDTIGYTLSDIGTYATLASSQTNIDKTVFYQQHSMLYNPYSYLVINSDKTGTHLNTLGAQDFLHFLGKPSTDLLVEAYSKNGTTLFHPIQS